MGSVVLTVGVALDPVGACCTKITSSVRPSLGPVVLTVKEWS